jgi:hypothetical protein
MFKIMPRRSALLLLFAVGLFAAPARVPQSDSRLTKAFRRPDLNGWIFVHLEGTPSEIGFQHGYLLAPEIEDAQKVIALGLTHDSHKPTDFFARHRRRSCGLALSRNIARRSLHARIQPVAARVRPGGHRAEQGRRLAHAGSDVV